MLEFVTELDVRHVDDRTKILIADFVVKYYDYTFIIPEGFRTDFASVPRLPIVYMLFAGRGDKAAVFHDYLYTTHELTRLESDVAFLDAMEAQGLGWEIRRPMYRGVRLGGQSAWDKSAGL
jgi:hypothetical protein